MLRVILSGGHAHHVPASSRTMPASNNQKKVKSDHSFEQHFCCTTDSCVLLRSACPQQTASGLLMQSLQHVVQPMHLH